jgi:hypothetical protein
LFNLKKNGKAFKKIKFENIEHLDGKSLNFEKAGKETLKQLYMMTSWLKNFVIVNSIANSKLIKKYKKIKHINNRNKEGLELERFNNQMNFNFHKIIKDVEHLLNQITTLYTKKYCNKNIWRSISELSKVKKNLPFGTKATLIILMIINILIFVSYFLITYIPSKIKIKYS